MQRESLHTVNIDVEARSFVATAIRGHLIGSSVPVVLSTLPSIEQYGPTSHGIVTTLDVQGSKRTVPVIVCFAEHTPIDWKPINNIVSHCMCTCHTMAYPVSLRLTLNHLVLNMACVVLCARGSASIGLRGALQQSLKCPLLDGMPGSLSPSPSPPPPEVDDRSAAVRPYRGRAAAEATVPRTRPRYAFSIPFLSPSQICGVHAAFARCTCSRWPCEGPFGHLIPALPHGSVPRCGTNSPPAL